VELAAALAPFVHATQRFYPRLAGETAKVLLAHHGARLVEELPEAAAASTLDRLRRQGVDVRLRTAVTAVSPESVTLDPGVTIPTRGVFRTAGVVPNPVVASLAFAKDRHGAVVVDECLRVPRRPGPWAIGELRRDSRPVDGRDLRSAGPERGAGGPGRRPQRARGQLRGRSATSPRARSPRWGDIARSVRSTGGRSRGTRLGCCGGPCTWRSYRASTAGFESEATGCSIYCSHRTWSRCTRAHVAPTTPRPHGRGAPSG
jgi:NADPH-dependent 2,4-dienoyl-CoA reductase/sulfur reductase-like enzyme